MSVKVQNDHSRSVCKILQGNVWTVGLDLKDAHWHMSINPRKGKFLDFKANKETCE